MKGKDKRKSTESSSSLDSLLKLLPTLALSYPGISSLLGQLTGEPQANTEQLQEALPKITQRLTEMDQKKKEELMNQLFNFFPELESLLKKVDNK
ncbi:MAG: hypothetical protein GX971_11745 [Firmicutes bacterium]|nr:hypothetical protein [Bacillota bacterium]